MSVNFEEIVLAPKLRVKSERAQTCTNVSELLASTKSKSCYNSAALSLNSLALEVGDAAEFTYEDILAFRHIEEVLMRERSIRQNYEREMIRIKNNMERVMHSNLPMHIKVRQMESMSESLRTYLNCMRESNKDAKERILRLERINSYMTALKVLNNWARKNGTIGEELSMSINSTLNGAAFMANIKEEKDNMKSDLNENGPNQRNEEGLMKTENEAAFNNKLEAVVILLKQAAIPFVIALENTKDDLDDVQNQVKQRKAILEERLRLVEELKRKVTKNDITINDKENVNPNLKNDALNKTKLRDVYLDFEEKALEMSMSRVNTSNLSVLQEASSKISNVFGKLFKKKQSKVPENIFTAEVLQDLGLGSSRK